MKSQANIIKVSDKERCIQTVQKFKITFQVRETDATEFFSLGCNNAHPQNLRAREIIFLLLIKQQFHTHLCF